MTLQDYYNKKVILKVHENGLTSLPCQINISYIQRFKKNKDLLNYYLYLITLMYVRNQIQKYHKLSDIDKKSTRNIQNHQHKFHNIHIQDVITFSTNFLSKQTAQKYFEEWYRWVDNPYIIAFRDGTMHVLSPKIIETFAGGLTEKAQLVTQVPVYKNKFNYNDFVKLVVKLLAEKPMLKDEKGNIIDNKLSFESIAQICGISKGRVSQILINHEKYQVFRKIDRTQFEWYKGKGRLVNKTIKNVKVNEETGEVEYEYDYFVFVNTIVKNQSNFNYQLIKKHSNDKVTKINHIERTNKYVKYISYLDFKEDIVVVENNKDIDGISELVSNSVVCEDDVESYRRQQDTLGIAIKAPTPLCGAYKLEALKMLKTLQTEHNINIYHRIKKQPRKFVNFYLYFYNWVVDSVKEMIIKTMLRKLSWLFKKIDKIDFIKYSNITCVFL